MKKILLQSVLVLFFIQSQAQENIISDSNNQAYDPSFTTSTDGKIIMSFVEKDKNNKIKFYYSYYDGNTFGSKSMFPL